MTDLTRDLFRRAPHGARITTVRARDPVGHLVAGSTHPLTFTLLVDGQPVDGREWTIALAPRGRQGIALPWHGGVTWIRAEEGTVQVTPNPTDLRADRSPYAVRFVVRHADGREAWIPNGDAMSWVIRK